MKLAKLNPRKGDLVLIVSKCYVGLYQFETMIDGYPFGKKGFELKKRVRMGEIELPPFIPLSRDYGLIPIPQTASQIYLTFDNIISALEMREGYELHARTIRDSRNRPIKKHGRYVPDL